MPEWSAADREWMSRALMLAERGVYTTEPNPRVGCVLVADGRIVGEGWHVRAGEGHAEVNALAQAGDLARGATAYVTLEPCSHSVALRRAPMRWSRPASAAWWLPCRTPIRRLPAMA